MKSCKIVMLSHRISVVGLLSCFFLLALTLPVHLHTSVVDHVQHECALCLLGAPSKVFVTPHTAVPFYYELRAVSIVSESRFQSLTLWENPANRSPPSLA
jgi:hypothetical protein